MGSSDALRRVAARLGRLRTSVTMSRRAAAAVVVGVCAAAVAAFFTRAAVGDQLAPVSCVHRLSTSSGMRPAPSLAYAHGAVLAPSELADRLCVYEVTGWKLLAPASWTGAGAIGADGTHSASLNSGRGQAEAVSAVARTPYFSLVQAAPYFPALRAAWASTGLPGPAPTPIPGVRETMILPDIARYSMPPSAGGSYIDGIILNGQASKGCMPTVVQLQTTLSAQDHDLAAAILNRLYVEVLRPQLVSCKHQAPGSI